MDWNKKYKADNQNISPVWREFQFRAKGGAAFGLGASAAITLANISKAVELSSDTQILIGAGAVSSFSLGLVALMYNAFQQPKTNNSDEARAHQNYCVNNSIEISQARNIGMTFGIVFATAVGSVAGHGIALPLAGYLTDQQKNEQVEIMDTSKPNIIDFIIFDSSYN